MSMESGPLGPLPPGDERRVDLEDRLRDPTKQVSEFEQTGDVDSSIDALKRAQDMVPRVREVQGKDQGSVPETPPGHVSESLPVVEKMARLIDESAQKERKAEAEERGDVDWVTRPKVKPDEAE